VRDGRLNRFIAQASDHLGLSLLWLAGCLPLVTAPVATTALFDVVQQRRGGQEPPIVRTYLSAFRRQLPTALLIGYGWAGLGGVLVADLAIASRMGQPTGGVLLVALLALLVLYALGSVALFPVLVSHQARPVALLRAVVLVALLFPGRGLLGLAALAAAGIAVWAMPLAIVVVPSLLATVLQSLYGGAFDRLRARAGATPLVPQ
jgi:membrane protein